MKSVTRHILRPERRTSTLFFDDDTSGEYYLRGGICLPFTQVHADRYRTEGYAVLVGYQVETQMRTLWEFARFQTVQHIVAPDGRLEREGLVSFLARCWSKYGARSFYAHDEGALSGSYRIAIKREQQIQPKPVLIDLVWPQQAGAAEQIIHHLVSQRLLTLPREFAEEWKASSAQGAATPAKHALVCALLGIEQHPWRAPRPPEEIIERI